MSAELFEEINRPDTMTDLMNLDVRQLNDFGFFLYGARLEKPINTIADLLEIRCPGDLQYDAIFKNAQNHMMAFINKANDIKNESEQKFDVFLFKLYFLYKNAHKLQYDSEEIKENAKNIFLFLIEALKRIKANLNPIVEVTKPMDLVRIADISGKLSRDYQNYKSRQTKLTTLSGLVEKEISKYSDKVKFEEERRITCNKPDEIADINKKVFYLKDLLISTPARLDDCNLEVIKTGIENERTLIKPEFIFEKTVTCKNHHEKFSQFEKKIGKVMTNFYEPTFLGLLKHFKRSIHNIIKTVFSLNSPLSVYGLLSNTKAICKKAEKSLDTRKSILSH